MEFVDSKISVGVPDDSPPPSAEKDGKAIESANLAFSDYSFDRKLESFILKVSPLFLDQLKENGLVSQKGRLSTHMYGGDRSSGGPEEEAVLTYWRLLTGTCTSVITYLSIGLTNAGTVCNYIFTMCSYI